MKKGFSPFEIMIALAVGSLLGTALMQVIWQLNKSLGHVASISSIDSRTVLFQNLLEKELAGAFIPQLVPIKEQENTSIPSDLSPSKQDEEKTKAVPQAFYSQNNQDGTLKFLTFITINPLAVYNVTKRRVARIMYTLRPDRDGNGSFVLFRQEDSNIINIKNFQERVKGFEVISGIKEIRTEFLAYPEILEEKKEEESKSGDTKKQIESEEQEKKELIRLPYWNVELTQERNAEDTPKLPALPNFIKMTVTLFDNAGKEKEFEYTFSPNYGIEPILLEGIKEMQAKSHKERTEGKLSKVMTDNPLSDNLQDKFSKWKPSKEAPSSPPIGGPVTRGME